MSQEFDSQRPIYRQIAEYCFGRILSGQWTPGAKMPSVRELAAQMQVNSHTVLNAYDYLLDRGIITPKRGLGYFLTDDAYEKVRQDQRKEFFENELPAFFNKMKILGISLSEIIEKS